METGRSHSDDREGNVLDVDSAAQNIICAAEARLPPVVIQDCDGRVRGFVLRCEGTAKQGLNLQSGKEIAAYHFAAYFFRVASDAYNDLIKGQRGKTDEVLKNVVARPHGFKNGHGHGHVAITGLRGMERLIFQVEVDELLRLGDRQKVQQDGIHDAEDGGIRANAEGDR